jgi:ribosomal-protein-alanine N-acetyltransferase|tara:strand:- start:1593 stop:1919 length:327 start_codon:yes stop_codon:yes gene_type:complete
MADEAHVITIVVRKKCRGQGVGELLLIALNELAAKQKAHIITLEVRISNTVAQNLYTKYGFTRVGLRHGYYTDNQEDALLMSTQDITSIVFQKHFAQLKRDYHQSLIK